ncbi:MAG: hypothetical protein ACI4KB_02430 [Oscillospiraceae bacterium]
MGKEKSNKKSVVKIVLGIVFFPITIYILIWKSKLSKKVKIILTVIWSVIFLAASAGSSSDKEKSDNKDNTSVVETVTTTEQVKETSAPETEATTEETTVSETEEVATVTSEETEATTEPVTVPETEEVTEPVTEAVTEFTAPHPKKVEYGKLISFITNEIDEKNVAVVKVKIEPSYSNKATINQNYFNVDKLIKDDECDYYDEIQYWAVADMSDGSEGKVISFTLNKSTINSIKDGNIAASYLGDYLDDLWVLPSLLN